MLNKKTLAEKLGVQMHTIVRWEGGSTSPALEHVKILAETLGYPDLFFYGSDIDEPTPAATSFRSQTKMSAATRDAALAAGAIGFQILDWISARFDLPKQKVPDLRDYEPDAAAHALRQEWTLGEKPVLNLIQLLESKGIRVFSLAENTEMVDAYSLRRSDGTPCVFLNTCKTAERTRFDAAHELAHLILHQDGGVTGRPAEDQANQFASAFLMPRSDVIATLPRVNSLQQLIVAKARWRVSLAALAYRVHKLEIISDWKYRDFCIQIATRFNKKEPQGIERETSILWTKVLQSLWSEHTTQADIAKALHVPVDEVSSLLFGVVNRRSPDAPPPPKRPLSIVPEAESGPSAASG